jgi:hypothetical protein
MSETEKLVRVDHQPIVRVLPCAGCGYPFDHELLGKYGCPNCEGELTEKATKRKIKLFSPYCHKGQSAGKPAKQGKTRSIRKPICYNDAAMKKKPQSRVREIYKDDDGWWANLAIGWTVDGCSGVREDTKRQLMERIKDAVQAPER